MLADTEREQSKGDGVITFDNTDFDVDDIYFDDEGKQKLIKVLERGLNTLSPPDMELIQLLEDMKK